MSSRFFPFSGAASTEPSNVLEKQETQEDTKDVNDKEVYAENSSKKLPQSSDEISDMI